MAKDFRDAREEITGDSWLDALARASLSAADAKFSPARPTGERAAEARTVAEPVTEYGTLYSGGGYLTMNPAPEIEAIYPMADRIRDRIRDGGHVYRRRIVVVEDWEEITEPPGGERL